MASFTFDEGANQLTSGGGTAWTTDTIKARLIDSGAVGSVTQTATVMTGMTAVAGTTDQTIASPTKVKDTGNHRIEFKCSAITWTAVAAGATAAGIVIFKFITNDAASIPLFWIDTTDLPTNGSDMTYTPDATNGVGYLQQ